MYPTVIPHSPLTAIIVTYNSSRHIEECLDAFLDGSHDLSVVIVDNNSQDDTLERIGSRDQTQVVPNQQNVGFSKAVNQALDMVPEDHPVLLLNPDARFSGTDARRLLEEM